MSLAYRVEELLALRDSVSESAVSLDKIDKQQALRGKFDLSPFANSIAALALRFPFELPFSVSFKVYLLDGRL